ncbi:MAG: class E sortase, partial [Actinomycetota bacterium]
RPPTARERTARRADLDRSLLSRPMHLAKVLGAVGRACITAGVLILLFVAYQLWGTGIREAQAQNSLEDEFEQRIDTADDRESNDNGADQVTTTQPDGTLPNASDTTADVGPTPPPPVEGDAMAQIRIPDIGVDKIVVEGVEVSDLKRGPGHYPGSPLPGQPGNVAIAGHRTTYGKPFADLDRLKPGDEVILETPLGAHVYKVSQDPFVVEATDWTVISQTPAPSLTLTACHPKGSARQRIVVRAEMLSGAPAQ